MYLYRFFIILLFITQYYALFSNTISIPASEFNIIKMFKTKHSFISIIRRKNKTYIVKQKRNPKTIHWSIIQSAIADHIASSIGTISSQHVFIIPEETQFPGKIHQNEAAALLTIVPGMSVQRWQMNIGALERQEIRELMRKFSIKQHPKLNLSIIRCMAKHKDLPLIVALHTLLGFYDGHKRNIFYDPSSDNFSIIDMDCSYKINLTRKAYLFLEKLLKQEQKPKIKNTLSQFANALECIMQKNPISEIRSLVSTIVSLMTTKDKKLFKRKYEHRERQIEQFLQESYKAATDIIELVRKTCTN